MAITNNINPAQRLSARDIVRQVSGWILILNNLVIIKYGSRGGGGGVRSATEKLSGFVKTKKNNNKKK